MAQSQPYGVSCRGGLNKNLNQFEMLAQPGVATVLENFEVDSDGGYRRINGFAPFGGGSAARPNSSNAILGLSVYADGLVACSGTVTPDKIRVANMTICDWVKNMKLVKETKDGCPWPAPSTTTAVQSGNSSLYHHVHF